MAFDLIVVVIVVVVFGMAIPPLNFDFASQKLLAEEIMVAILRLIAGSVHGERLNRYEAI